MIDDEEASKMRTGHSFQVARRFDSVTD